MVMFPGLRDAAAREGLVVDVGALNQFAPVVARDALANISQTSAFFSPEEFLRDQRLRAILGEPTAAFQSQIPGDLYAAPSFNDANAQSEADRLLGDARTKANAEKTVAAAVPAMQSASAGLEKAAAVINPVTHFKKLGKWLGF